MKKEQTKSTAVATVNGQEILIIENGEKRVAVRPICDALGIDFSAQLQRLKRDEILSSVVVMVTTTGADGKQYEMATIPYKFSFGWLFTIDNSKVKPEAKEALIKYQLECYNALYEHFTGYEAYYHEKEKLIKDQTLVAKLARANFAEAKSKLKTANEALEMVVEYTFEDYKNNKMQLVLVFDDDLDFDVEGGE